VPRVDEGARVVRASPEALYRAHVDPEALAAWRAPEGMRGEVYAFDPRPGGVYRMALVYETAEAGQGKTTEDADVFEGRFVELIPNARIVEAVRFTSDDPAFAGEMRMTTTFTPVPGGTEVRVRAEDVPPGISADDHAVGIASSLANLAAYVERG
jgi:uncharacterized protein YndB with AHSA1/START domain